MTPTRSDPAKLLTVRLGRRRFGLDSARVREVVRMPDVTRVPHAPPVLLGLASVRGTVMPVLSLAQLLGREDKPATRAIVFDAGEPVALAVSEVGAVAKRGRSGPGALNVGELIAQAMPARHGARTARANASAMSSREQLQQLAFLEFSLGEQDFALPLGDLVEVLPMPEAVARIPGADPAVVGSIATRAGILPLLSLRALLDLPDAGDLRMSRIVVAQIGTASVGFVVDRLRSVLRVGQGAVDPLPVALDRSGAEARIQAICRADGGSRLVSVLAAEHVLREEMTARLTADPSQADPSQADPSQAAPAATDRTEAPGEPFLLFRNHGQAFGLPAQAVERVMNPPARMVALPNTPGFVPGAIHLGGELVPVVDQGPRADDDGAGPGKLIVARAGALRAAFRVDEVHELARLDPAALTPTPALGERRTRVFDSAASIKGSGELTLLMNAAELLAQAEQDLLHAFMQRIAAAGS